MNAINLKCGDVVVGYGEVISITVNTHDVANVGKVGSQDKGTEIVRGNMTGSLYSAILIQQVLQDCYHQEPRSIEVEFLGERHTKVTFEPEQVLYIEDVFVPLAEAA